MKLSKFTIIYFLVVGLALTSLAPLPVLCGQEPFQSAAITYKPPTDAVIGRRLGMATRGQCKQIDSIDSSFHLQALAPDSIGQTTFEQPTLYWSISKSVSGKFSFTITEDSRNFTEPVLDVAADLTVPAGIHALPLTNYDVKLKSGVIYKWSVSLECDPENPSQNVVTSGLIKRVNPVAALNKSLSQAKPEKMPYLFAISGYWYDSLSSLSNLIEKHPTEKKWREVLTNLLRQGGLDNRIATLEK